MCNPVAISESYRDYLLSDTNYFVFVLQSADPDIIRMIITNGYNHEYFVENSASIRIDPLINITTFFYYFYQTIIFV